MISEPRPATRDEVPVLDLTPLDLTPLNRGQPLAGLAKELRRACETIGFFYVQNHGVPKKVVDDVFADLLSHCSTPVASVGLHASHPLIGVIERMKPISYPARVYAVTFNGVPPLTARPAQPEAALL